MTEPIKIHVRFMLTKDFPRLLEIERLVFKRPHDEQKLRALNDERQVIGMTAIPEEEKTTPMNQAQTVLGGILLELQPHCAIIRNVLVDPAHHRLGIGTALLAWAKRRLGTRPERTILEVILRDTVPAFQDGVRPFFAAMGFDAETGKTSCRFMRPTPPIPT